MITALVTSYKIDVSSFCFSHENESTYDFIYFFLFWNLIFSEDKQREWYVMLWWWIITKRWFRRFANNECGKLFAQITSKQ